MFIILYDSPYMTLDLFDKTLIGNGTDFVGFVQKYIFHGTPYVFNGREEDYFEFRKRIASRFGIGFHEVFIIGSAKLGFSYVKKTVFSYDSDIDIVIVNEPLFELFFKKISEYQYELDRNRRRVNTTELELYNRFLGYLVKGWMRPDLLPTSFQVGILKNDWFDFFKSISNNQSEVGNYEVKAGLYKNYEYLERYHVSGITNYYKSITI